MQTSDIENYARQLYDEIGARSVALAARRAIEADEKGDTEDAGKWRRIEEALLNIRGPRQS